MIEVFTFEGLCAAAVLAYTALFLLRPPRSLVEQSRGHESERVAPGEPAMAKGEETPSAHTPPEPLPTVRPRPQRIEPVPSAQREASAEKSLGAVATSVPQTEAAPAPSEPVAASVAAQQPVQTVAPAAGAGLSWFERLKGGLDRTRKQMLSGLDDLFSSKETRVQREVALETVFELLIRSDVGVKTTEHLVGAVKERLRSAELSHVADLKNALKEEMLAVFEKAEQSRAAGCSLAARRFAGSPHVVMVVGVNGVGKTTTTGKMAHLMCQDGARVVVGAADTFRAAAVEQLKVWAQRAGADCVTAAAGADPASVGFDAVKQSVQAASAGAQGQQVVCFVDTAGRLHNRKDLMEELSKVRRVMGKAHEGAPHEVLLVVDATTGQNAIQQARTFMEVVQVDGLVLTKLDGTAKGGVALAIAGDLGLPIRYVGVGEAVEDLQPFDASTFVEALFRDGGSAQPQIRAGREAAAAAAT